MQRRVPLDKKKEKNRESKPSSSLSLEAASTVGLFYTL